MHQPLGCMADCLPALALPSENPMGPREILHNLLIPENLARHSGSLGGLSSKQRLGVAGVAVLVPLSRNMLTMNLPIFPLPLPPNGPPAAYGWEERDISLSSTTCAFNAGIDRRDLFLGRNRCVVCGNFTALHHCLIIRDSEPELVSTLEFESPPPETKEKTQWANLRTRNWIPSQANEVPRHEPRDGLLMCSNHHTNFDDYSFFIRFMPEVS